MRLCQNRPSSAGGSVIPEHELAVVLGVAVGEFLAARGDTEAIPLDGPDHQSVPVVHAFLA